jgi:polyphosphate kinase 2 (PPK2 family)
VFTSWVENAATGIEPPSGLGQSEGLADHRRVRRARWRRQGRHHQSDYGARKPARVSRRRAARAVEPREVADVYAALRRAFSCGGEIVIFDRSWYNRAGVEHVMGFCSEEEHRRFLRNCPQVEKFVVDGGIQLIKYWLEVSNKEQERRFEARINDPLRQWKLSPVDLPSRSAWYEYSRARDLMLKATDTKFAPWYILH